MPPKRRAPKTARKSSTPESKPPPPLSAPETPTPTSETPTATETLTITPPPAPSPPPSIAAKPSSPPPDASASAAEAPKPAATPSAADAPQPATTRKVRKIIKKVIIKKIVPKGTLAARKAAAEAAAAASAEAPKPAEKTPAEKPAANANVPAASAEAPKPAEETPGKKPATNANATAVVADQEVDGSEEMEMSERQKRRRTEIFVGGLDRDAKEGDVRKVFAKAGEIAEVRMMVDAQTGKNKGYCFVRYREPEQAKKAITQFGKVEICGKLCGAAALEGNDTIFLGNIDKKWKKEDIIKLLQEIGVENIDTVTLMADLNNPGCNRGFAFLELETNRDAQLAYKKLTKKDVFGKDLNIKVAWAEPLNEPDEEEMQKVKSIFVEGIPTSWDQAKLTEIFKKYGIIERLVLSRDIQSAKRKDFAFVNYTTREAAILCLESFDKEKWTENGSKVNIKVSLAKPVQKGKQSKGGRKFSGSEKDKPKIVQSETKVGPSSSKVMSSRVDQTMRDKKPTTTHELLHVLREQAAWRQGHASYASDPAIQDYSSHALSGEKRALSTLDDDSLYPGMRGYPRPRYESSTYPTATSSYGGLPHGIGGSSRQYYHSHQGNRYPTDSYYKMAEPSNSSQMRQAGPQQAGPPYGSRQYQRY